MTENHITLHGSEISGHTHRVELLLRALDLPYRFVPSPPEIRRSDTFLALNPLGQVPVLQDGDVVLADSNAILVYLAKRYAAESNWLPDDPVAAASVQRWLSIAAGEIASGPNIARLIVARGVPGDRAKAVAVTDRLLHFMNGHLLKRPYLVAAHPTIADLACYSYIAAAPEGGIELEPFAAVCAWLRRIETIHGFKPMPPATRPT
ncbi:glutathione S-transferase family protein [Bradyrhizobium arachidis]|uniref:Glutathione S-transferase n=1 Tax=Bradyrhizobium arachidis TaxID=858423 RepID=A0AAE7TH01_9BRAD|nr:glutathione S-transferase N-terminal domain-containing protein [Bradyrhizobium arachidis]QOZ67331.1 glutathione S-transferase [Bradyrhizobium arachidis]SFU80102.1 glutathione S-transferase [Bradyrhizobium arachidis]